MKIEIYIDGEKKQFVAQFVPMLARRKYLEIEAQMEELKDQVKPQNILDEQLEFASLLADVIFKGQFTTDQLFEGVEAEYFKKKLNEAIFGTKPLDEEVDDKGNQSGK